jgi:uncharacterized membrane protein
MHDPIVLILACAAITYATRIGGHVLLSRFKSVNYRFEAALHAVPIAVLTALIAPALLTNGPAEALAIITAAGVAMRAPLIVSVASGMAVLIALRHLLA